jgi:APA family basic amino acid/polyamine antiporter
MARDGAMPPLLGRVAPGGTPRDSLVLLVAISMLFAATGGYESIVRLYAPWTVSVILIVCLAQIRLRISEPDLYRPWRTPLFPLISIAAALVQASFLAVIVWDDPVDGAISALVVAAPIPVYLLLARRWGEAAAREFG